MTLLRQLEDIAELYAPPHRVPVVGFLARHPMQAAFELIASHPALGLLLAHCGNFRRYTDDPWDEACRMVMLPRTEILAWLGFPATKSAVRILGKVNLFRISVDRCVKLRELFRKDSAVHRLRHLPSLCDGVVDILADDNLCRLASFALLEEICQQENDLAVAEDIACVWKLADLQQVNLRKFRSSEDVAESLAILQLTELGLVPEWLPEHEKIEFPESPISVPNFTQPAELQIEPIRTPRDLYQEAVSQHICVFDFLEKIASGKAIVYRVMKPERSTVMLTPNESDVWTVEEFCAARNRSVSKETVWTVGAYLSHRQERCLG